MKSWICKEKNLRYDHNNIFFFNSNTKENTGFEIRYKQVMMKNEE